MIGATPLILFFSTGPIAVGQPPLVPEEYTRPLVACRYGVEDCHPLHRRAWFAQHLEGMAQ